MTAVSLADLLAGQTANETLQTLVALGAAASFPVSSWQPGSTGRSFFELESIAYSDFTQLAASVAASGFVLESSGPWLDLIAAQLYNLQRRPAVYAQGTIRLTDAGGVGPIDLTEPGQLFAVSNGVRFRNLGLGTLPLLGSVDLTWEAEFPGAGGNVPDGQSWELSTTIPGVTVATVAPPGGTWLSQQGTDEEGDPSLQTRCTGRWGELGHGATAAAYRYWAATASAEVTRCAVVEGNGDGNLFVNVAGALGPVSDAALAAINAYLFDPSRRVQCVYPLARNAPTVVISLAGAIIKVRSGQLAAAKIAIQKAIVDQLALVPLGGIVYRAPLEASALRSAPGVVNVVLPFGEIDLGGDGVPVADFTGVLWVPV